MYFELFLNNGLSLYFFMPCIIFVIQIIFGKYINNSLIKTVGYSGLFAYGFCAEVYDLFTSIYTAYSIFLFAISSSIFAIILFPRLDIPTQKVLHNELLLEERVIKSNSTLIFLVISVLLQLALMYKSGFSIDNSFNARISSSSGGAYYFRIFFIFINNFLGWSFVYFYFRTLKFRYLLYLVIITLGSLSTMSRGAIAYPVLIAFLALYNYKKKYLIFLFFVLLLGLPILYLFGEIRNQAQIGIEVGVNLEDLNFSEIIPSFFRLLFLRLSSLDDMMGFIPFVFDLWNPFYWILSILSQPIPRTIWTNKPFLFETMASKYSAPEIFEFGGSESVGLLAESLFTAHVLGPIVYGFIFVFIIKILINIYTKIFKSSFFAWGAIIMLPYGFMTSGLLFGSITVQVIYILFISVLFRFIIRKTYI